VRLFRTAIAITGIFATAFIGAFVLLRIFMNYGFLAPANGPFYWLTKELVPDGGPAAFLMNIWLQIFAGLLVLLFGAYFIVTRLTNAKTSPSKADV
jgi:hypothetical protein